MAAAHRIACSFALGWVLGCGDSRAAAEGTGADGTPLDTAPAPTGTGGGTASDGSGSAATTGGESGESGGDEDGTCQGLLCGAGNCCSAAEDCVDGACADACASGVRCGANREVCCDDGQVCLADACTSPGDTCKDSFDCGVDFFCEPTLGRCLPQIDPLTCEVQPDFDAIELIEEWSVTDHPFIATPAVADLDGDGVNEVVTITYSGPSLLMVFDATTGAEKLRVQRDTVRGTFGPHNRSTVGVADVSGDGLPDVVYAGRAHAMDQTSLIHAIDHTGALLWTSRDAGGALARIRVVNGGPTLANFDDDPEAEIVLGASLLDNDGTVLWAEDGDGGFYGTNRNYEGGISAIADLDGDGYPEIISGAHAWKVTWPSGGTASVAPYWAYAGADGYPAIADLDLNGTPEVILVADGEVIALEGTSGELWCGVDPTGAMCDADDALRTAPLAIPGAGRGGPPTVADFDGDGRPEVGVAGGSSYSVYDFNRDGEEVVQPMGDAVPGAGAIFVRWKQATRDQTSNATGSSVFDFQGDGVAEVVYADECFLRVYSGTDGTPLVEFPSTSATIHEYPLVVDADGDGNSEILVVANTTPNIVESCTMAYPGYVPKEGLFLYGDAFDRWVPTRTVWTSHAYHVTNATSDGNVPVTEVDNWTVPGLNDYRKNSQGAGVFNAPNLKVELATDVRQCPEALTLVATVTNDGALGVPAGAEVAFHDGADATAPLLGTVPLASDLLPGASVQVVLEIEGRTVASTFFAQVDAANAVVECNEDDNTVVSDDIRCPVAG